MSCKTLESIMKTDNCCGFWHIYSGCTICWAQLWYNMMRLCYVVY